MNDFVFENSTRFYFGRDALSHIADELADAQVIMVVYGGGSIKRTGIYDHVVDPLIKAGKTIVDFPDIMANPTWDKVCEGAALAQRENVDYILAIGGGSVIDCAKAVALAARQDDAWEKHWVRFEPIEVKPIPLGMVVTAAGTGSEGNGGAVITNEATKVKTGKDYPQLNARFAIQDPKLTFTVPEAQTVAGGYDALNHLMEIYFSMPVGDVLADDLLEAAMRSIVRNLPKVVANPEDYQARANLLWASSLAENRILKSGKSTCFQCHMIEHQIGAYTNCVHGFGLAAITTNYYRRIYNASEASLAQFVRFAQNVWGIAASGRTDEEVALAGIDALEAWTREMGAYYSLAQLGCTPEMLPALADSIVCLPTSFKQLTRDEVFNLLEDSM